MKTLNMNMKFGVILTGFIMLASCGINSSLVTVSGINAIYHAIPSLGHQAGKSSGDAARRTFDRGNRDGLNENKALNSAGNFRFMPISIGLSESAPLVSSPF